MALSVKSAIDRTFSQISKGRSEAQIGHYRDAIERMIPLALKKLADRATEQPDFALQRKKFGAIAISGSAFPLDPAMAIQTIPTGDVADASGLLPYSLVWLPDQPSLKLPRNDEFVYYTIDGGASVGGAIYIKAGRFAKNTPTSLIITCGAFPSLTAGYTETSTFSDLPQQYEDDLVDIMVQLILQQPEATKGGGAQVAG